MARTARLVGTWLASFTWRECRYSVACAFSFLVDLSEINWTSRCPHTCTFYRLEALERICHRFYLKKPRTWGSHRTVVFRPLIWCHILHVELWRHSLNKWYHTRCSEDPWSRIIWRIPSERSILKSSRILETVCNLKEMCLGESLGVSKKAQVRVINIGGKGQDCCPSMVGLGWSSSSVWVYDVFSDSAYSTSTY